MEPCAPLAFAARGTEGLMKADAVATSATIKLNIAKKAKRTNAAFLVILFYKTGHFQD